MENFRVDILNYPVSGGTVQYRINRGVVQTAAVVGNSFTVTAADGSTAQIRISKDGKFSLWSDEKSLDKPLFLLNTDAGSGAVAAFSLRKLSQTSTKSVRVRRSSDEAALDIGFTSSGDLDVASLESFLESGVYPVAEPAGDSGLVLAYSLRNINGYTGAVINVRRNVDGAHQDFTGSEIVDGTLESFCQGAGGLVTTFYNQAGGVDLVQTTASLQGVIVSQGVLIVNNGKPAMEFDDSTYYSNNYLLPNDTDFNIMTVLEVDSQQDVNPRMAALNNSSAGVNIQIGWQTDNKYFTRKQDSTLLTDDSFTFLNEQKVLSFGAETSNTYFVKSNDFYTINSVEGAPSANSNQSDGFHLFKGYSDSGFYINTGFFQEVLVFSGDVKNEVISYHNSLNNYYSIYAIPPSSNGFVTTWYNQAPSKVNDDLAGYSNLMLSYHKRNRFYNGYCINVRRSSDEAALDIGFTSSGDLDVASLESFVGAGNDGFITTWYDQSGNGYHAVQNIASLQPYCVQNGLATTNQSGEPAPRFITPSGGGGQVLITSGYSPTSDIKYSISSVIEGFDQNASYAVNVSRVDFNTNSFASNFILGFNDDVLWYRAKNTSYAGAGLDKIDVNALIYEFDNADARVFSGSTQIASVGGASSRDNFGGLGIGGRADATSGFWDGTISEIIVFHKHLNDVEKEYLQATQENWYNSGSFVVNDSVSRVDLVQNDASKQPVLSLNNGEVFVSFDGVDDELVGIGNLLNNGFSGKSVFFVANDLSGGIISNFYKDGQNISNRTGAGWSMTPEAGVRVAGNVLFDESFGVDMMVGSVIFPDSGVVTNDIEFSKNTLNVPVLSNTDSVINTIEEGYFQVGGSITNFFEGGVKELLVYPFDKKADKVSFESSMINYYFEGVYSVPYTLSETINNPTGIQQACVTFNNDETILVVGSLDNNVYVYHTADYSLVQTLTDATDGVLISRFSPDSTRLAIGSRDSNVYIYDTSNWALVNTLTESTDFVVSLDYSHNGSNLAVGSSDSNLRIYDTSNYGLVQTLTEAANRVNALSFNNDDTRLAASGFDTNIRIYDTSDYSVVETLTGSTEVDTAYYNSDGSHLAVGGRDFDVRIYDTTDYSLAQTLTEATDFVVSLDYNSDGSLLVTGSKDANLRIYDTTDYSLVETKSDGTSWHFDVQFSPGDKFLASANLNGNAFVYKSTLK